MKQNTESKKEVKAKLAAVFGEKLQSLPCEYQKILIDDLITAFESRFAVLRRAQDGMHFCVEVCRPIEA